MYRNIIEFFKLQLSILKILKIYHFFHREKTIYSIYLYIIYLSEVFFICLRLDVSNSPIIHLA